MALIMTPKVLVTNLTCYIVTKKLGCRLQPTIMESSAMTNIANTLLPKHPF